MKKATTLVGVAVLAVAGCVVAAGAEAAAAGPPPAGKGIAVVLGLPADGGRGVLAELAEKERWTVLFHSPEAREAAAVREWAEGKGLLGDKVFVAQGGYGRIVLADNLATAAWVQASAAGKAAEAEISRVLHPGGTGHLDGKTITKPVPEGVDVWSHPYHGPDNNPLSTDRLARAPYLTQFIAEPKFSPLPTAVVAAGGRVFRAHGHISFQANQTPVINTLVCSNGYSGTVLWTRPLKEGFMVHRMCMAATDDALYLADDESCKVLDAATGKVLREIAAPEGTADGKVWKWMVLQGGKLYALIGGPETQPKPIRATGIQIGHWPWSMWDGFDYREPKTSYGFGRTFLAFEPSDGKVLWRRAEEDYIDGRGICMGNERIYYYCPEKFLAALDARTGEVAWKNTDADLLKAIGPTGRAQNPREGFSTTSFLKCDAERLYFAGPQRPNVVVASAADGRLLWQRPDGNFHLVPRPEGLYGIGAAPGFKLDFGTWKAQAQYPGRRSCTRATGSTDAIFYRAPEGTVRIDLASGTAQHIAAMRPPCLEGVIVAHGMLYWGPWMCGCPLAFYGHVGLTGAGSFNFQPGLDASRLEPGEGDLAKVQELAAAEGDWTAWSADPQALGAKTAVPKQVAQAWELFVVRPSGRIPQDYGLKPALPTGAAAAGGLVFTADRTGAVRAFDAATGAPKWKAYAAGAVFYPPAVWNGRLYLGSADGRVYAFEAATGRRLWAFRLAPADRWIPVFGRLASTWPVAGGVVVRNGVVYAAAGMADYDGTHVAALDAVTGKPLWYNDATGRMSDAVRSGISLQGELMLRDGRLCFAGGGVYGTAVFDAKTGKCLNDPVHRLGSGSATAFYAHYPEYGQYVALDHTLADGRTLSYEPLYDGSRHAPLALLRPVPAGQQPPQPGWRLAWRRPNDPPKPTREAVWTDPARRQFNAFVVTPGVLLAAGQGAPGSGARPFVTAIAIDDGSEIWRHELPAPPVKGGLAVDRGGRIFASLADGRVLCLAERR
ncbi:MAG: hypothetical protein FJ291_05785 [Planctomycetes bacterium]|nr:hypothetical protein [Planctomycetota bacterium]